MTESRGQAFRTDGRMPNQRQDQIVAGIAPGTAMSRERPRLSAALEAILAAPPPGSGAGKPSASVYCLSPKICDHRRQCENWLRTEEGCQTKYFREQEEDECTPSFISSAAELASRLGKPALGKGICEEDVPGLFKEVVRENETRGR